MTNVLSLAVQADGKILVGGSFYILGGQSVNNIGRLNPDGTLDTGFNPGANGTVNSLALQADGKILVGGQFTMLGGESHTNIGRLYANGTVDATFNPGANAVVNALVLQADGKILVGGGFTTLGGQSSNRRIGRLNADGSLDTSFNLATDAAVNSLAVQADGKILVVGVFTTLAGQSRSRIGRLNAEGTLDTSFNLGTNGAVSCLALQADGKIVVGGGFTTLGGQGRNHIGRLNADGSLDSTFINTGANLTVNSVVLQADGKIIVAGQFTTLAGQPRNRIGRLNADGTLDTGFNPGAGGEVRSLAVQADGKILVAGLFTTLGGQNRFRIGRLNNTGAATQNLAYDGSTLTWTRGGTSPEVWRTTFEYSPDGNSWTSLGEGMRIAGGWQLTGLALPTNTTFRARGYVAGGYQNGSGWLVETFAGQPLITSQPGTFTRDVGTTVAFNVEAVGSGPLSYQWRKDGNDLPNGGNVSGVATASLTLNNVFGGDAGGYSVVVSNSYGSVTSLVAALTVMDPLIIAQPVGQDRSVGESVTFGVTAIGTGPFDYQWRKDGGILAGATQSSLTFSSLQGSDAGSYDVVVSNPYSTMVSTVANLVVKLPNIFTVTNTGDGGPGSLRQAMINANGASAKSVIQFNIPGAGPFRIRPTSALPDIQQPVDIDGATQPGYSGVPLIEINGGLAGNSGVTGVKVFAPNCTFRGLVVNGFSAHGIWLLGGSCIVEGCYVGTSVDGLSVVANLGEGVVTESSNNRIGGPTPEQRNVISGNRQTGLSLQFQTSTNNLVIGNFIGLDRNGLEALGNGDHAILVIGNYNVIGGTQANERNILSASEGFGIELYAGFGGATGNIIQGNYIGTDVTGLLNRGNAAYGIAVNGAMGNTIGGIGPGQGNLIAFNGSAGIAVHDNAVNNPLRGNSIFANGGLGIELGTDGVTANDLSDSDSGPNALQNYPELTSAFVDRSNVVTIFGKLNSRSSAVYTLDFYANSECDPSRHGEGRVWVNATTIITDASGNASFSIIVALPAEGGTALTATATDASGNTSEFSSCVQLVSTESSPIIVTQPASFSVPFGSQVAFVVETVSASTLGYQWRKDGNNLADGGDVSGAARASLTLSNVFGGDAGGYSVVISNSYGSVTSLVATLTVIDPLITSQPVSQIINAGDGTAFNVGAIGTGPLSYQWRKDGVTRSGATQSSLTLTNLHGSDAGNYDVVVSNSYGSVTSVVARLTVEFPTITIFPQSQLLVGQVATFTLQANTTSPLAYQWQFNGSDISGETNTTLTLTNLQLTESGDYRAVVRSPFGSATTAVIRLDVRLPEPLDGWSLRRGVLGSTLNGITFGNGIFVAVGYSGAIQTSADGMTWTDRSVAASNYLFGIAYGNGMYVAVGNGGEIFTSVDGIAWIHQDSGTSALLRGVTYANGLFVAVGYYGILTSPDGVHWTPRQSGRGLSGVAYGNGKFVAVGNGAIVTSEDGVTWADRSSGGNLTGVTFGNRVFMASGYAQISGAPDYGYILVSTDGTAWQQVETAGDGLLGGTYGSGTFVAVGFDDRPHTGIIRTSPDGTNWTSRISGTDRDLNAVAYGNGRFVAVGGSGAVVLSVDGSTWHILDNLHSVTSGNGLLAALGAQGTILTSTNGVTWSDHTEGNTNGFDELIFANNMFIAVGNAGAILSSPDGVTWTTRASGATVELHSITYDAGLFVAVGRNGTILTSPDGISWIQRNSGTTSYLKAVTSGAGVFVAVGNISSNVLTSTDGITWTYRNYPPPYDLNLEDIAYGNGIFVVVGDSGYIATSPDGVSWTSSPTPAYQNLRAVTYANGLFVVVGNNGTILTSEDGVTWILRSAITGNNLRDIAYFNSAFIAVGNDGTILQSGSFAPARLLVGGRPTHDGFELFITGEIGRTYRVQARSDLSKGNWVDLFTFDNTDGATTIFLDSQARHFSKRFYRVVSP